MKKLFLIFFVSLFVAFLHGGLLDQNMNFSIFRLSVSYNDAMMSDYKEYPGEETSDSSFIWGDFNTRFVNVNLDSRIFASFILDIGYTNGAISSNKMYINSLQDFLTIKGASNGFHANLDFRIIEGTNGYFDIYGGFIYTSAEKKFNDYMSSGVSVFPGEFGSYKINMFGPNMGLRADWIVSSFWGIGGKIEGSPYFENNTIVAGWTENPIEEYAKGYRCAAEFSINYKFLLLDINMGARFEKVHFNSGENATHDLDITYIGPFAELGFSI